ncbi:MAG TPA: CRTAC1 family protein [Planctomycetaceae bacterium]|nr:CRTAC1 family protein [Planctomycetaceae bacterium]
MSCGLAVSLAVTPWILAAEGGGIVLRDVTPQTGITFKHTDGSSGAQYLVEAVSAGLVLFDYDGDGWIDIYLLNGAPLKGYRATAPPRNALYRNLGGWRFVDVTDEAGVGDQGFGLGATAGDFDNDGDLDLYLNNYGPNVLYRNNGDGTFTDVTNQAGVANGFKVGAGTCFLDADADGDLDLYVSNYIRFSYETHVRRSVGGYPWYPSPRDFPPEPDTFYRNNGDRTFTDVSIESGVAAHAGTGMGMTCADADNDGDTDVFVCNDVKGNFFFENDGTGRFKEVALMAGVGYNLYGDENGSMGVDCGDYNNDGWLDFFMTDYAMELPVLYKNMGGGFFMDVTQQARAGQGLFPYVNWGAGLVDFDNDGDRDLFVACGHLQDHVDFVDDSTSYRVRNVLLMNTGDGRFVNVSPVAGDGMLVRQSSRGAGFDDLDNDGDIDVVVLNSRSRPTVLRNDSPPGNHWVEIELEGVKANRDGVGARVEVAASDLTQIAEVHSGRGYQSHYGMRLHFGLGRRRSVDRVLVRWIGGGVDVAEGLEADRLWRILEGRGATTRPVTAALHRTGWEGPEGRQRGEATRGATEPIDPDSTPEGATP